MMHIEQRQQQGEQIYSQTAIPPQNIYPLQQQTQAPAFNTQTPQQLATSPERQQTMNTIRLVLNSGQPQQALATQQVPYQEQQHFRNPQVQSTICTNQGLDINQSKTIPRFVTNRQSSLQPKSNILLRQPTTSNNNGYPYSTIVSQQSSNAPQQKINFRANPRIMPNSTISNEQKFANLTTDNNRIKLIVNDQSGRANSAEITLRRPPPTNQQNQFLPQGFNRFEQQMRQQIQTNKNTKNIKLVETSALPKTETFESQTKSFTRCGWCQEGIFEDKCILRCQCKFHKSCLANFLSGLVFKQKGSQLRCRCKNKIFLKDIRSVVLPNIIQQLLNNQLYIATTVLQLTKCSSSCPYLYKHIKGEIGQCQTCKKPIT